MLLEECWHDNRFSFSSNFSTFFKAILLKNKNKKHTTLAISDYNFLSVLPLKERLDYNKRVLKHKIMSEKVPPSLTAKCSLNQSGHSLNQSGHSLNQSGHSLNQSGHSGKLNIAIPRSDLFKFSVVCIYIYISENVGTFMPTCCFSLIFYQFYR